MNTTARLFGFSSRGRLMVSLACVLQGLCGLHLKTVAAERACQAAQVRTRLTESIMPYWYDTSVDRTNGGFILADDGTGKSKSATQKMIVTQARMVWSFSHAHIMGLGSGQRDYLGAAAQGRSFISKRFFDRKNGGYFWTTDLKGEPVNRSKLSYGQAFVIYGFVEYYRASKDREALDDAMAVYDLLQRHAHDLEYRGWGEHFTQEWTPTLSPGDDAVVELPGCKSANTHLHLMEAFTELYEVTGDVRVKRSLEEALETNMKYFYPRRAGRSCFHRKPDWTPVTLPSSLGVSYGHNVEFAWLMIRAQKVLKKRPDWGYFDAIIDHTLRYGYDHERGGVYSLGFNNKPAHNTSKVWWVQAEMLAALTHSASRINNTKHSVALDKLLAFVSQYQADRSDGVWFDTVGSDGEVINRSKAHNWKANYHDVRALTEFVSTFSEPSKSH